MYIKILFDCKIHCKNTHITYIGLLTTNLHTIVHRKPEHELRGLEFLCFNPQTQF